ncbi:MAG: hypothetical protein PHF67_05615 [Candidatus Nanoarchaeia archaeon]|nr:hypothetical protein [Candidatus Nanoarchaeia archaeon]
MEKEFGKIKKNAMTDIIIRIDDFGGKPGLTIREFNTSDKYTGFTKSGTRISAEAFKDFKAIINAIDEKDFGDIKPEIKAPEPPPEYDNEVREEPSKPDEQSPKKSKKKKVEEELF